MAFELFLTGTQLPEELLSPQSVATIPGATMTQQGFKRFPDLTWCQAPGPCPPGQEDARGGAGAPA